MSTINYEKTISKIRDEVLAIQSPRRKIYTDSVTKDMISKILYYDSKKKKGKSEKLELPIVRLKVLFRIKQLRGFDGGESGKEDFFTRIGFPIFDKMTDKEICDRIIDWFKDAKKDIENGSTCNLELIKREHLKDNRRDMITEDIIKRRIQVPENTTLPELICLKEEYGDSK